jgi:hypothetical protein
MSDTTLLDRTTGGLTVEIRWLPITETLVLAARTGDCPEGVSHTLAPDRVLDAFGHPMSYLSDAQVDKLFPEGA